MNPRVERAHFEGMPLTGLRGMPTEFFAPDQEPDYQQEDFGPIRPIATPRLPQSEVQPSDLHEVELKYSCESGELGNRSLPVYEYRKEIVHAVEANPFTIIVAETGAGKSTQVPQFLLDEGWDNVYLTQPRRAAARNVYERIRSEIGSVRGDYEAHELVGYQTAGERDGPEEARIKVVTDGLQQVRELHNKGIEVNDVLIIDEVHEWNSNIEVLVAWVKKAVYEKPNLRVVIMSATMDAHNLAHYFSEVCHNTPPIIEVPGRTYKVERLERPDSTVSQEVIKAAETIHAQGEEESSNGILVFEPGKREINDTIDEIQRRLPPEVAKETTILPLHAKLSVEEQQAAFIAYPGVKIVVATDVAQTSLTIPDIKYVIDSGYQRRMELDDNGVQGLVLAPISQADCDQRAGRAGRVSDGHYILTRMDPKTSHIPYINREKYPLPEIMRTDLVRNTLRVAAVGLDVSTLDLYHPVEARYISKAQDTLRALGAIDTNNEITSLGLRMNEYPVYAASARMMVEALYLPEQTRAYMAAIVAAKEVGGLPYFAYNVDKRWRDLTDETSSDLLAQLDIFIAIQDMSETEMRDYDLDLHNVERAREQYRKIAKSAGALRETLLPPTEQERDELRHCIYTGLMTSVYKRVGDGNYQHVTHPDSERQISNRSLVAGSPQIVVGDPYRVEYQSGGETLTRHIIEHATAATLSDIGKAALHLTEWTTDDYTLRNDKFVEIKRQSIFGIDTGISREVAAKPSEKLREIIIEYALENAGPQQRKLRQLKKELEQLAHLAKDPVKQLTHDQITSLVHQAAPADITDPAQVEHNLRNIMLEQSINRDTFVSPDRYERIIQDAPRDIFHDDMSFEVTYRNSKPLINKYKTEDIARLHEDLYLADGRQIFFVHEGKKCTLLELRSKLNLD